MAIRTAYSAFLDLPFCLCSTLGKTDVNALVSPDMVEIEGTRIVESTIDTANRLFVFAEPCPKRPGSLALVISITRSAFCLGAFIVGPAVLWVVWAIARTTVRCSNLIRIAIPPATGRFPLTLLFFFYVHRGIVSHNSNPCKPDIFEATYDLVKEE